MSSEETAASAAGEQPAGSLNPAQQAVIDRLGGAAADRPVFRADLRDDLRAELEARLTPIAERLDDPLHLSKHSVEQAMGCERRLLAERDEPFAWSPAVARGAVAHKAIELSVHRRDAPAPLDLVDDAMGSLMQTEKGLGDWLRTCGDTLRAEVRGEANNRLCAFLECWPPLSARWRPALEARMRADLCDDRVTLQGKTDLALGQPDGMRAGKVIVDFKTGRPSPSHAADLRFYALVETLRLGVPPRMLATSYLDAGRLQPETVTEDTLFGAVDRVVDAAGRIVTLLAGERDAVVRTGPPCRWCVALASCPEGASHLAELDDD